LLNGNKQVDFEVLIDSGADYSVFDAEIGGLLDLELQGSEDAKDFRGIGGGQVTGYRHEVGMIIGGHKFQLPVYFAEDLGRDSYGVLGQRGFFEFFRVRFIYSKQALELKPRR